MSSELSWLEPDVTDLPAEDAVTKLIEHAAGLRVSDVFFITNRHEVQVAVRHMGILRPLTTLPMELGKRCMAHIKAVSGMDVSEHRRPLDGRSVFQRENGSKLDLRINTLPTLHGEDFTLRILERDSRMLALDELGMVRKEYNQLLSLINSPSGLILVTGPTGSGKTTTLYGCLTYLNNGQRKLNTIEDPIEYAIEGIRQSQVNPRIDVHFAELLRGVLRQAPDVIMIGEIRDSETAETAVRAANSGHLVLATLHAPIAAGAIQSMLSLGVHPHFLSSCLLGCISQRLVRILCTDCRVSFDMGEDSPTFEEIKHLLDPQMKHVIYGPGSCAACYMSGYFTRSAVFEVLHITRDIRRLVMERQPVHVIRKKAVEEGMLEFRQSALLKVARGETSVEEVFRVVPIEYLGLDD